jgi:hypothetical protein
VAASLARCFDADVKCAVCASLCALQARNELDAQLEQLRQDLREARRREQDATAEAACSREEGKRLEHELATATHRLGLLVASRDQLQSKVIAQVWRGHWGRNECTQHCAAPARAWDRHGGTHHALWGPIPQVESLVQSEEFLKGRELTLRSNEAALKAALSQARHVKRRVAALHCDRAPCSLGASAWLG